MDPQERAAVVALWWEQNRLMSGTREEQKALTSDHHPAQAAWEAVDDMVYEGAVETVQFLAYLAEAGPDEDAWDYVGAGPLEDLINQHGDRLIDEIDRCARQLPSFRDAMRGVWYNPGTLSPATEQLLLRWVTVI